MASPPTSVAFPSTSDLHQGPTVPPSPHRRQPLISFRRISLPPPPGLLNRQSSASLASFDSFPDGNAGENGSDQAFVRGPSRKLLHKHSHVGAQKRQRKRRESVKPRSHLDEHKALKRRKIITEFYDTERAYIQGLDLIYSHFLTPIIESLDSSSPLLEREDLVTVFSNFVDIWNLHRSFFTSLTELLSPSLSQQNVNHPPLSPILVSHFPYLSLYAPFITSFPEVVTKLANLQTSSPVFATFLREKEADERCGKLKLRDWLLTIVQRCPRYLLLLKDLINNTDPDDPEHASLIAAHTLLSKVTTSLDTSLHTHAQTLTLLAFQRATPNLPIQLVYPGRTFLKRGTLMQLDNSSSMKEREFLLFSDCLIWLANSRLAENDWQNGSDILGLGFSRSEQVVKRPEFKRRRSKSENELPDMRNHAQRKMRSKSKQSLKQDTILEERWIFIGSVELVDVEVIIAPFREPGDESRLEILSPEMSFAIYAESERDRDEWASAIRSAKSSLLVSLNVMHPHSTLASSSATDHLRRSLQASPYLPENNDTHPKRGKVDHYVPAIWVPDGKAEVCMRCGNVFNWRRRRHHCRLCGRCVCGVCSEKTFFITDPSGRSATKPARACNACYDTVFPLLNSSNSIGTISEAPSGNTLSSFPSWKTQKPIRAGGMKPSELMDLNGSGRENSMSTSPAKRAEVIRRSRPLSYPVIPQAFSDSQNIDSLATMAPQATRNEGVVSEGSVPTKESSPVEIIVSPSILLHSPDQAARGPNSLPQSPIKIEDKTSNSRKRFSMPAVALQTTSVTTRPKLTGEGPSKRFSLVLGGRSRSSLPDEQSLEPTVTGKQDLRHGIAAAKLLQLMKKSQSRDSS